MSRLLWCVFVERWPEEARLVTLVNGRASGHSLDSSTAMRLRFGAQMAVTQASRQCDWIMYSHVSVAKVQAFVPAPLRRPYAVFIHGIEAWEALTPAQEAVLNGAALRVANSTFTADRVRVFHPGIGPIAVCPLALCPDRAVGGTARAELDFDPGPRAVILVARMSAAERYKGHDELLAAWTAVCSRVADTRLVFVGDGDDMPRLKARAASLGLGDRVVFAGFVSPARLAECYRRAAVFAMPSRGEGFGLVYLEAMASGRPCIGAWDDAAREVIEDGRTGFLVPQADRAALSDRLIRLLTDDSLRAAMGAAGRRAVEERFSFDRFSRTILSLVDSHLAQPPSVDRRPGAAV